MILSEVKGVKRPSIVGFRKLRPNKFATMNKLYPICFNKKEMNCHQNEIKRATNTTTRSNKCHMKHKTEEAVRLEEMPVEFLKHNENEIDGMNTLS